MSGKVAILGASEGWVERCRDSWRRRGGRSAYWAVMLTCLGRARRILKFEAPEARWAWSTVILKRLRSLRLPWKARLPHLMALRSSLLAGMFGTREALESNLEKAKRRVLNVNFTNTIAFCEVARKMLLEGGGETHVSLVRSLVIEAGSLSASTVRARQGCHTILRV